MARNSVAALKANIRAFDTHAISVTARQYAAEALERIAWLMHNAESDAVQLAAAVHILDRAYGKAPQSMIQNEQGEVNVSARVAADEFTASITKLINKHTARMDEKIIEGNTPTRLDLWTAAA